MAFTFLKAQGYEVGKSLVEDELIDTAKRIFDNAKQKGVGFYLPVDCIVADKFAADAAARTTSIKEIPADWMALDVGPASVASFAEALTDAKTIIWNGPMGVFEMDPFSHGTFDLAAAVAGSSALTITGGGDTDVAVNRAGVADKITYISTGGGAFLELLEGKKLPGIKALEDKGKA